MRKLFSLALVVVFAMSVSVLAIAQENKPLVRVAVGADTDFVIGRDVALEDDGLVLDYSSQNYGLKVDVVIGDILILTPRGGLTTLQAGTDVFNTDVVVNSGVGFNLGIDAQLDVLKTKYADFSAIGSYRFIRADIESIEIGGLEIDNPIETVVYTHEFEVGGKVSKDLKDIGLVPFSARPYIGLVYSDLVGTVEVNSSALIGGDVEGDLRAEDHFGIRTGISIEPVKDLTLSVDAKFLDQTAIGGSVSYKF